MVNQCIRWPPHAPSESSRCHCRLESLMLQSSQASRCPESQLLRRLASTRPLKAKLRFSSTSPRHFASSASNVGSRFAWQPGCRVLSQSQMHRYPATNSHSVRYISIINKAPKDGPRPTLHAIRVQQTICERYAVNRYVEPRGSGQPDQAPQSAKYQCKVLKYLVL